MAKQTIEQLQVQFNKIRGKLMNAEEEERNTVHRPLLRKSLGLCFKYLNSYGGSSEKWWLYERITGFDEKDLTFQTTRFQHTSADHIEIRHDQKYNFDGVNYFTRGNYIQISLKEYERECKKCLRLVEKLLS